MRLRIYWSTGVATYVTVPSRSVARFEGERALSRVRGLRHAEVTGVEVIGDTGRVIDARHAGGEWERPDGSPAAEGSLICAACDKALDGIQAAIAGEVDEPHRPDSLDTDEVAALATRIGAAHREAVARRYEQDQAERVVLDGEVSDAE